MCLLETEPPQSIMDRARFSYEMVVRETVVTLPDGSQVPHTEYDPGMSVPIYDAESGKLVEGTKPRWETVNSSVEVEVDMASRTWDGMYVLPRHIVRPSVLEAAGYEVVDTMPRRPQHPVLASIPKIKMREGSQSAAFREALYEERGVIVLGPGRGKTVLALELGRALGVPILVFVDNGGLYEQWVNRASQFYDIPREDIGRIQGPPETWTWEGAPITIAMYQSFTSRVQKGHVSQECLNYFGTVFWDELHVYWTKLNATWTIPLFNAYRFGLTATPHENGAERVYLAHIGPVLYEDVEPDLYPDVFFHRVEGVRKSSKSKDYGKMCTGCLGGPNMKPDPVFAATLIDLLKDLRRRGRKVMVITPRNRIMALAKDELGDIGIIKASTPAHRRPEILEGHDIVFVARKIGEQALDRQDLDTVVYPVPSGSTNTKAVQQGAGRALRALAGKATPEYHILYPASAYGAKLCRGIQKICKDRGYTIKQPVVATDTAARQRKPPGQGAPTNRKPRFR
jgi:superfamily II DNA or RNA helicase